MVVTNEGVASAVGNTQPPRFFRALTQTAMIRPALKFAFVFFSVCTSLAQSQDRLVLLDGSTVEGTIKTIGQDGSISGEGISDLVIDELRRIETPVELAPAQHTLSAALLGGGQIHLSKFSIDEQQQCHLHNAHLGEIVVPIDAMRSVRFEAGKPNPTFEEGRGEKRDEDRVFVKLGGGLEPIDGLIESIDDFKVVIDPGGGLKSIAREKVYGIVFAMVGRAPDHSGEALVTIADGSTVWGQVTSLADGTLSLKAVGDAKISLPWSKVHQMQVRSSRMVFLSDLEPVEARHQPLVTLERPHQMDASVAGNPLTLGGRQFDKGIGVAANSTVVFANESNFGLFAATIGIDEETEGRGDCVFVVEVDGREKLRQRMTGKDAPQKISVDIDGGERVALIVEAGEDLDLSDHADWCDARVVKK